MNDTDINEVFRILKEESRNWKTPYVTEEADSSRDPFRVLISCVLSLRTKDEVTGEASRKLFSLADNPSDMLELSKEEIIDAIYPVGFYNNKADYILSISRYLVDNYDSEVPNDMDELLKLKGVGRKTANLVITKGFGDLGICVDTHVHRISNRWGYVDTENPEETEAALRSKLPEQYWIQYNDLLVSFGQNICVPVSPKCSECPVERYCDKVGVKNSR